VRSSPMASDHGTAPSSSGPGRPIFTPAIRYCTCSVSVWHFVEHRSYIEVYGSEEVRFLLIDWENGTQVCQLRAALVKDAEKREAMWERQHDLAADKMYSLCSELGGLFLKVSSSFFFFITFLRAYIHALAKEWH
jgi:hypothetical protein